MIRGFPPLLYRPSASPLKHTHHFPGRLTKEDLRRDDVGSPLKADGTGHGDRADHGLNEDRDASLASLTADYLYVISCGSGHTGRVARLAVDRQRKGETTLKAEGLGLRW